MSLDLGQLTLWQNITVAVLIGLTFIFSVIKLFKIIGFTERGFGKFLLKEQIVARKVLIDGGFPLLQFQFICV